VLLVLIWLLFRAVSKCWQWERRHTKIWNLNDIYTNQKIILSPYKICFKYFVHYIVFFPVSIFTISINCVHCWLLHATLRYFSLCYTIGTCIYVHTVLQNGLQISSSKKCFMIWYCVELNLHKQYIPCISCGTWNGKSSFLYRISIKCILPNNNNASQSWPTVQLAVP
jgi:hypothetical protein